MTELSADDRRELEALIVEFAWRVDHQCAASVVELIASDGSLALGGQPMVGHDAIIEWATSRPTDRTTRHVCTNARFEATGRDQARGWTTMTVYMRDGPGPGSSQPAAVGEYHDEFTRRDGTWQFTSRRAEVMFVASAP